MNTSSKMNRRFSVTGMMCAGCAARVEKAARVVPVEEPDGRFTGRNDIGRNGGKA